MTGFIDNGFVYNEFIENELDSRHLIIEQDVLQSNNTLASKNRAFFQNHGIVALNIMSSPGSGKTTTLEHTISTLGDTYDFCVVEGDQQTQNDAQRIKASGARAVQVNTGDGCHLEAGMIAQSIQVLKPNDRSFFIIENVGNLVCPAMFDLGETKRIVVMSVTEGEDKPLKYPNAFRGTDLCLVNKVDLLPYLDFDVALLKQNLRAVNPAIEIIETSSKSDNAQWHAWLIAQLKRI